MKLPQITNQHVWLYDTKYGLWDKSKDIGRLIFKDDIVDYSQYPTFDDYKEAHENDTSVRHLKSSYSLYKPMQIGDMVIARYETHKIVAWGIVKSDYHYDSNNDEYKSYREVDWHITGDIPFSISSYGEWFYELSKDIYEPMLQAIQSRYDKLNKLIELFISLHQVSPFNGCEEKYKWEAIGKSNINEPLEIIRNFAPPVNLFYRYSYATLAEFAESRPNALSVCISNLLNEDISLESRLVQYKKDMNALKIKGKACPNDERTAAVFLTCLNPQKYTFYMRNMLYLPLCKWLSIESEKNKAKAYLHYLSLLRPLAEMIGENEQLSQIFVELSKGYNTSNLLNAQTLLWCIHKDMEKMKADMEELVKFKHLLEYFVAHLNFVQNGQTDIAGYDEYIKPWIDKNAFKYSGQGYDGDGIQKQVRAWESYKNGRMCININPRNYTAKNNYINWASTGLNIIAEWENNAVKELMLIDYDDSAWSNQSSKYPIADLGLYEENEDITINLTDLFVEFNKRKMALDMERLNNADKERYKEYVELLKSNRNLILTGAPGTGKTYMAHHIADVITEWTPQSETDKNPYVEMVQFHPSYDYTDFVEGIRPTQDENGNVGFEYKKGVFMDFCEKSLQKYDVTNFDDAYDKMVLELGEGIKELKTPQGKTFGISVNSRGNLRLHTGDELKAQGVLTRENIKMQFSGAPVYKWWKGYFEGVIEYLKSKYNLKQEQQNKDQKYVFIIDEINRGEISKIFGELFFSIDPGYRGTKSAVRTQYANMQTSQNVFDETLAAIDYGHFFVPENVYIIGTMNDIDRSVESMDFGMRRRFAFKEVTADESYKNIIENNDKFTPEEKDEIKARMTNLNNAICDKKYKLGKAYQIGASYFLKYLDYKKGEVDNIFETLWKYHLKGLLYEYLRGNFEDTDKQVEELKEYYDKKKQTDDTTSSHTDDGQ